MTRLRYDYDLIVLGTGGGGSVAAHIAAAEDKKVAIVEPAEMGGDCPNWSCIPSKALLHAANIYNSARQANKIGIRSAALSYNYPSIKAWKDKIVERTGTTEGRRFYESAGIKVITGAAHFIGPHEVTVNRRHYSATNFIIATGSHIFIPAIEGLEKTGFVTYKEAANLTRPPKSLFIIGAGSVGCEFATLFSTFGTKIYLADITSRVLPKEDVEISDLIREVFEQERGVKVLTNSKVIKVVKENLSKRVYYQNGTEVKSVKVDEIMVATGKSANVDIGLENADVNYTPQGILVNEQMQTTAKHIYAAGDVVGPHHYTHLAIYQSRLAAHNILHRQKIAADYRAVPRCVYTSPEVASVGLSESECTKRDLKIVKVVVPISIIGRANLDDQDKGFVKIIATKDGDILGASIISPHAGEMIHELTLAIQHRLNAQQVANTIHAFPSWNEAIRAACSKVVKNTTR